MLPAEKRLTRNEIVNLPQDKKLRLYGKNFDIVVFPYTKSKFAFIISKKVAPKSTRRNLLKRKLSDIVEQNSATVLNKAVLIIVKQDFANVSNFELENELKSIFSKIS